MRTLFHAILLRRGECFVKVIADQANLDLKPTEHLGFLNFLLRRRDGHENHTFHTEMTAHKCNTLGVVARACTNENRLLGDHFAHRVERSTQLI